MLPLVVFCSMTPHFAGKVKPTFNSPVVFIIVYITIILAQCHSIPLTVEFY